MNFKYIYFVFLCVFQVFFCTFIGGISLGNAFQSLEDFWNAKGAAGNVFPVIKRVRHTVCTFLLPSANALCICIAVFQRPMIDIKKKGEQLKNLEGRIEFRDVDFTYPTRTNVQVRALKKLLRTTLFGHPLRLQKPRII